MARRVVAQSKGVTVSVVRESRFPLSPHGIPFRFDEFSIGASNAGDFECLPRCIRKTNACDMTSQKLVTPRNYWARSTIGAYQVKVARSLTNQSF